MIGSKKKTTATTARTASGGRADVRTARIHDRTWNRAADRALGEGHSMSHVVATLVKGYAEGQIDLPTVAVTWTPTRQAVEAPAPAAADQSAEAAPVAP